MPSILMAALDQFHRGSDDGMVLEEYITRELVKRVKIPINSTTPPEMIRAIRTDPWRDAGQYALGWVYIPIILIFFTLLFRVYNYWGDKIRTALYKEEVINSAISASASPWHDGYELPTARTDSSTRHFFPPTGPLVRENTNAKMQPAVSSIAPINNTIAFIRWIFYRPTPTLKIWKWKFTFPSPGVMIIIAASVGYSIGHCFIPQPLFYKSMAYGSPPVAIRAGMMSVAIVPWIVALASKVNLIAMLTGIEPQRLIVLHRWGAYICAMLAIIHAVPYWYQSVKDPEGFDVFKQWFHQEWYIFTTGIAAIAPLMFLVLHSLPILRTKAYELFVFFHAPMSWAFVGLMFWHCNNYLTSWAYLYATIVLLVISLVGRLFYLNWSNPIRPSFLIGEESAVTILPENAIKITVPTQKRWKPGQYAYIRMPGIALLDNHPFTIASLCSEDFPSDYGEQYRDLAMVFRPFGGFTRKVLNTATAKGPYKTYRAFIEGPYGGMQRQMASFDQVIFFAGGSGITAIASQLIDLIKRMRDGKATTRVVHVVWAMKRPEIMEWFKEELRICREHAPPGSVYCNFYITSAKRYSTYPVGNPTENRLSGRLADKVNDKMQDVASKRNSKLEGFDFKPWPEDEITALPPTHLAPPKFSAVPEPYFPPPPGRVEDQASIKSKNKKKQNQRISTISAAPSESAVSVFSQRLPARPTSYHPTSKHSPVEPPDNTQTFDFGFGFPTEPTPFQKSLMRFAFLPTTTMQPEMAHPHPSEPPPAFTSDDVKWPLNDDETGAIMPGYSSPTFPSEPQPWRPRDGWRTEYGRPDIAYTLRSLSKDFGRRTCVFVCGPPEMRQEVSRTVAELQSCVWRSKDRDELFLHTENYAL